MKIKKENKMKVTINFGVEVDGDWLTEDAEVELNLTGDKTDYDPLVNKIEGFIQEYKEELEDETEEAEK
jgi:hypothetical protein